MRNYLITYSYKLAWPYAINFSWTSTITAETIHEAAKLLQKDKGCEAIKIEYVYSEEA